MGDLRLYLQKGRWYERNSLPWNRLRIHREFMRRRAFVRWPVHGNVLEALREGRLEVGEHTLFEPYVWITAPGEARVRIGSGSYLNIGVMVAAHELVEIGDYCMLANGCFVTDANHRFDDLEKPVPWQGFTSKGPTRIGDNVWCGANVVITSGVTVGERCVIGANSVVTRDLPPLSIASFRPSSPTRRTMLSGPASRQLGLPAPNIVDCQTQSSSPSRVTTYSPRFESVRSRCPSGGSRHVGCGEPLPIQVQSRSLPSIPWPLKSFLFSVPFGRPPIRAAARPGS